MAAHGLLTRPTHFPLPPYQALLLLWQLLAGRDAVSDRFYRALYVTLLSDGVRAAGKAPLFMSLLFKVCVCGGGGGGRLTW